MHTCWPPMTVPRASGSLIVGTVTSLHPLRLCRIAVFSLKPTFLTHPVSVASWYFQYNPPFSLRPRQPRRARARGTAALSSRGTTLSVRRVLAFRGCLSWYRREVASICDRSSCAKSVSTLYNSRVNKHRGAHRMLVSQLVKGVLVARGPESLQNHLHHLPHP